MKKKYIILAHRYFEKLHGCDFSKLTLLSSKIIHRWIILLLILPMMLLLCKDQDRFVKPNYVLKKWSRAIEKLDYKKYSQCEAYPKSKSVFREMYKDYYLVDIMTTDIEEADEKKIRMDLEGNSYIRGAVSFEATIVKRINKIPYQIIRGNADFIKFIDGKRKRDGWLISNRSLIRINR
ncbi:MAG: hypothetical protein SVR08_12300 [Spirochaetota bacterium]|nr:hypothetical protein [Spirochaetota bacterium]